MPELSVLILTYNEGENIGHVLARLKEQLPQIHPDYEIVVVDGGSKDATQERAREGGARVFQQVAPGYGAAFREGLAHTQGRFIATLDADCSHNPEILKRLWEKRDDADIVIASRYMPGGSAALPPFRRFLSTFLNTTYRLVLGIRIYDLSSGLRLYRGDVARRVPLVGDFFDVLEELLIKAIHGGARAVEIPFHFEPRATGESHLRVVKFGIAYGKTLFRLFVLRRFVRSRMEFKQPADQG